MDKLPEKIGKILGYTIVALLAVLAIGIALLFIGFVFRGIISIWNF